MESHYFWYIIFISGMLMTGSIVILKYVFLDEIINYQIGQELALKNGSEAWERWVNLPVPIYLKVYLFAVINPDEISKGGTPILKEQGPYVYREVRKKKNIRINSASDSITYDQEILFYFDRDKSGNCTEDDEITVINPAIMTIVSTMNNIKPFEFFIKFFDFALRSMFDSPKSVFLTTTIRKILFDGEVIKCSQKDPNLETLLVCTALQNLLPVKVLRLVENGDLLFALLKHKNGSGMGELEIKSGIKEPKLLGKISKWNNANKLTVWSGDPCNNLEGNDMTLISPYQNPKTNIELFSTDICRSVSLSYQKKVTFRNIPGLRFILSPTFLGNVEEYPRNECYCNVTVKGLTTPSSCLPKGALDISSCIDVPVVLTKPHFLEADPKFLKGIYGLEPDYNKHVTYVDVEPRSGVPLQGFERVQFNIKMENISYIQIMRKLPNTLFPLMWIEEGTQLQEPQIEMINDKILHKLQLVNIILWAVFTVGSLFIFLSILIIIRNRYKKKIN